MQVLTRNQKIKQKEVEKKNEMERRSNLFIVSLLLNGNKIVEIIQFFKDKTTVEGEGKEVQTIKVNMYRVKFSAQKTK